MAASCCPAASVFEGFLRPGEDPVIFAVVGDFGEHHRRPGPSQVASMIKSWKPDFVVAPGDVNYGTTTLGHLDWDSHIGLRYGDMILGRQDNNYPLQVSPTQRFFPVIGNHDTTRAGSSTGGLGGGNVQGYVDYFVRNAPGAPDRLPTGSGIHGNEVTYYDFYWGDMHFVMADSDRGRVEPAFAEAQNAWIRSTLQGSRGTLKFVVCHHPAWSSDSVHGSQAWMRGDHLSMADAVFAGHAHVYERLDVDGTPYITSGAGGRSLYGFRNPPLPESRHRHNSSYGAVRVTKNNTGALCEFLSIADGANGANGGIVLDRHALGDYEEVRNSGCHPFEAVAGQSVHVVTTLPAPPGGGVNSLDPRIEILSPDGVPVAANDDGAADAINAELTFDVTTSGTHMVRVLSQHASSGNYMVLVDATPASPADPYEVWTAQHFGFDAPVPLTAADADPDRDGSVNLLEYATGTDPLRFTPSSAIFTPARILGPTTYLDIRLHHGLRDDVTYEIQGSTLLGDGTWETIATRSPATGWSGPTPVVTTPQGGGSLRIRLTDAGFAVSAGHRLYRLRVHWTPPL